MSIHDRTTQERIKKCAENGAHSEDKFAEVLTHFGYQVFDATEEENIKDHIDKYFITPEAIYWGSFQQHSVDIKGIKDFNKCDNLSKYLSYNILEYTNVNGDKGWLYGKADYIAFETEYSFILVVRSELLKFALDTSIISPLRIDKDPEHYPNPSICDAFHKMYRRKDALDIITVVSNEELKQLNGSVIFSKDMTQIYNKSGIA